MHNKKSTGIIWYGLLLVLVVSTCAIIYSKVISYPPTVGEIPLELRRTLEENSRVHFILENITGQINEHAVTSLENNNIWKLKSFCEGSGYIDKISDKKQKLTEQKYNFGSLKDIEANCYIDETELMRLFQEIFKVEYDNFREEYFEEMGLDPNAQYSSQVIKEDGKYFNLATTTGVEVPIIQGGDLACTLLPGLLTRCLRSDKIQIGKIIMKPAFKFNIDYDFNAAEDICILSYDCGATCGDAENFDPMYKVRTYTCGEYFYNSKKDDYSNCREGLDDFNKQFECGEPPYSCYGDCPLCTCKRWRDSGCCEPGEKRQVRSCKHYTCPDDTERCVGVSCDEPCGEGCEDDSE